MITPTVGTASAATNSIDKVQSGLVASDSLTSGNTAYWTFDGTATLHDYYEDNLGLHLGVQSPGSGTWVNYYAASPFVDAQLFHAVITIPYNSVADGVFNPGLYVEGSDYAAIVGCQAFADWSGYYWTVQQTTDAGMTWTILYESTASSLPHTQDCTVVTNGSNLLKVYLGGSVVFSSTTMDLNMPYPLRVFFQDDTSSSSSMRYATYLDYYATTDENIRVINNPSNAATVKVVDSSGQVLSSSPVTLGTATLDVGVYQFPLSATINVYDSNNSIIALSPASIYGGDVFSVTSSPATVPQPPTNLSAIAASSSQINLSWNAPSDDGGSPITGYKIRRSSDGGATWSTIVPNTGSTTTTYSNTGLSPSTTYTYSVSAINSVGSSTPFNIASATTLAPTGTASLTISTVDNNNNPLDGYYIEIIRDNTEGTSISGLYTPQTITGTIGHSYTVTVADYGSYSVQSVNIGTFMRDNDAKSGTTTFTLQGDTDLIFTMASSLLTPPSAPTGLTATAVSSSQINLSWNPPSNNGGSPITGYKIYRGTTSGGEGATPVATVSGSTLTYTDSGLTNGQTYYYTVKAVNSVGTSAASNEASATPAAPATVPAAPTGLGAIALSSSQISLSWSAPTDNGGSPITGYEIERSANGGSTWTTIVPNTGSTATTYSDAGLAHSTTYTYRVFAINSVGTSLPSNTASATTSQQPSSINLVKSGLVASDSLIQPKTKQQLQSDPYWRTGGSAAVQNAPIDIFQDAQGMHIGVQAVSNGTYAGYYAVTPSTNAPLFHAVMTSPVRTIPSTNNFFQNGLYVQTTNGLINYVTCVSITGTVGTTWHVIHATGNFNQTTGSTILWSDPSPNQPLTKDCTIITNGSNYLKVYLDGVLVYSSNALNLQMPGPFEYFLEPQSNYAGQLLYGTYKDYYAASDESIKVTNNPPTAATVKLVDSSGSVLAIAPVVSGTATLDVGEYHFPLAANIKVFDSNNAEIVSTSTPVNIVGGDVYSVNPG